METMKITYLAGCTTCNDGLTDHIADLLESGEADTQVEAVRQVTDLLNEKLGYTFFSEKQILGKYRRTLQERLGCEKVSKKTQNVVTEEFSNNSQERGLGESHPLNDGTTETSDTKSPDSGMVPFDVQARQEEVKRNSGQLEINTAVQLSPETVPVPSLTGLETPEGKGLTYGELEQYCIELQEKVEWLRKQVYDAGRKAGEQTAEIRSLKEKLSGNVSIFDR